jgi:hypothetical protein
MEQNPSVADSLSLLKRYPAVYVAQNGSQFTYGTSLNSNRPLGLQEIEAPRISGQTAHERGEIVSPRHRPPLPTGDKEGDNFC